MAVPVHFSGLDLDGGPLQIRRLMLLLMSVEKENPLVTTRTSARVLVSSRRVNRRCGLQAHSPELS
jgi:hypothetical protein